MASFFSLSHEFFEVLVTFNVSFMSNKYYKGKLHVHKNSKKNVPSSLPLKITRQVSSKRREPHSQRRISYLGIFYLFNRSLQKAGVHQVLMGANP